MVSISQRSEEMRLKNLARIWQFQTSAWNRYLQMHLLAERFFFSGWWSGLVERKSQDLSNGSNIVAELDKVGLSSQLYSPWIAYHVANTLYYLIWNTNLLPWSCPRITTFVTMFPPQSLLLWAVGTIWYEYHGTWNNLRIIMTWRDFFIQGFVSYVKLFAHLCTTDESLFLLSFSYSQKTEPIKFLVLISRRKKHMKELLYKVSWDLLLIHQMKQKIKNSGTKLIKVVVIFSSSWRKLNVLKITDRKLFM